MKLSIISRKKRGRRGRRIKMEIFGLNIIMKNIMLRL